MSFDRIKVAVEFLKDGKSFKVGGVRLGMSSSSSVYVTGWTRCLTIDDITKNIALKELAEIKLTFDEMVNKSGDLEAFLNGKNVTYNLAFDYGMGAVGVCSESGGVVEWKIGIKD